MIATPFLFLFFFLFFFIQLTRKAAGSTPLEIDHKTFTKSSRYATHAGLPTINWIPWSLLIIMPPTHDVGQRSFVSFTGLQNTDADSKAISLATENAAGNKELI